MASGKRRSDGLIQRQVTINGKRKVFYGKNERDLNKKIAEFKEEAARGRTFAEVAEEWWGKHLEKLAYNSVRNYLPAYKRTLDEFASRTMSDITPKDAQLFISRFAKRGYAQKTVQTQLLVLHLICEHAVIEGDIPYNIASPVQVPRGLSKEKREMPTEEELQIVRNSLDKTFGLFAFFLLYTGCRRGEALALTHGDIDRQNCTIFVNKSLYHISNSPHLKTPKTAAGTRSVILLDILKEKLPEGKRNELLFPNEEGGLMTEAQARSNWKKYLKETGLNITPHQLRHAYATILFDAGVDDKDAQELLGHANISTTRDIYTHISKSRFEKTAQKLNAAIGR